MVIEVVGLVEFATLPVQLKNLYPEFAVADKGTTSLATFRCKSDLQINRVRCVASLDAYLFCVQYLELLKASTELPDPDPTHTHNKGCRTG